MPEVAVPASALVPARALSFVEIELPHVAPSDVAMPTPSAIVDSGATLVRPIVTLPVVETVNGKPVVPDCATVPENASVEVAAVGAVVVAVEDAVFVVQPATPSAIASESGT